MWAVLGEDNKTVIGMVPPTATIEQGIAENPNRILIEMTTENSPAYMLGTWDGTKFHPPIVGKTDGALR